MCPIRLPWQPRSWKMASCGMLEGALGLPKVVLVWFSAVSQRPLKRFFAPASYTSGGSHTTLFHPKSFTGEQAGAFFRLSRNIS